MTRRRWSGPDVSPLMSSTKALPYSINQRNYFSAGGGEGREEGGGTSFISRGDLEHFLVASGAEDFHQSLFIRPGAFHGFMELFGAVVGRGHHQPYNDRFEIAAQFALEVFNEILETGSGNKMDAPSISWSGNGLQWHAMKWGIGYSFELLRVDGVDGLPLAVGPPAQHVDDFLLAGAEPLHGASEDVGVT